MNHLTIFHKTSIMIYSHTGMAAFVLLSSILVMIFYALAFLVNDVKRKEAKIDNVALMRVKYLKYREEHVHSLSSASEDRI